MKRIISIITVLSLLSALLAGTALSAGAVPLGMFYGDVDYDFWVDSTDVTLIQRHLSNMVTFDALQKELADYDHDSEVGITDVTIIQRVLAKMSVREEYGGSFLPETTIHRIYSDYASGKAMIGVPVTITANGIDSSRYYPQPDSFFEPIEYRFEIGKGDYVRDENGDRKSVV